jgi:hypothetical protein
VADLKRSAKTTRMSPGELLKFGAPGTVGTLSVHQWTNLEKRLGQLPSDYKETISLFGHGSFGCMSLLHPLTTSKYTNLEYNESELMSQFRVYLKASREFIEAGPRILGLGPERYAFCWLHGKWWHLDFEMDRVTDLGPSIVAFIHDAYRTATGKDRRFPIGESIWATGDGDGLPFFQPARGL